MKRRVINFTLIAFILIILSIATIIKVSDGHNENLWKVTNKYVLEAANRCKNEKTCMDDNVSLKFLIDQGYIQRVVNPVTKEYINEDSYVDFINNEFIIK